jgi:lysophospholipase L1-like esterase
LGRWFGIIAVATVLAAPLPAAAGEISVRNGDSIAFVGDSNTAGGWEQPAGYVHLVQQALELQGITIIPIPAGVAGDTSERMFKRIDAVLAKKPTWMTLSCGFNDVSPVCMWQVGYDDFTQYVTGILDKAKVAGVKVIVLTPTLFRDSTPDNATNRKMLPYIEFLRTTAKERGLPLADLNAVHRAEIARLEKENSPFRTVLYDGIHMAPEGNQMMAAGVLAALGLTQVQIDAARERWLDNAYRFPRWWGCVLWQDMTVRQFLAVEARASRDKTDVDTILTRAWVRAVIAAAQAAPKNASVQSIVAAATKTEFGKQLDALSDPAPKAADASGVGAEPALLIKSGDKIAFVGDANTPAPWESPWGYISLVQQALELQGITITPIPAGVPDDTSERMDKRIDTVLAKKPDWMTLNIGFNDVKSPVVSYDDFTKHVTGILDKAKAAGVKVIVLTPTLFDDNTPDNATNRKLLPYVEFLRQTAKERGLPLADLNARHRAEIARLAQENAPVKSLIWGGQYMTPQGFQMMAAGILEAMGSSSSQIDAARKKWLDVPYRRSLMVYQDMNVRRFFAVKAFAAREAKGDYRTVLVLAWHRALITAAQAAPANASESSIREAAQVEFLKQLDALGDPACKLKNLQEF